MVRRPTAKRRSQGSLHSSKPTSVACTGNELRLSPEAEQDVQGIARHIAVESPSAARQWVNSMHRHLATLGTMPGIGAARFDIRPDLRMFAAGAYLILYRRAGDEAVVIRVIHGARQWQDLL